MVALSDTVVVPPESEEDKAWWRRRCLLSTRRTWLWWGPLTAVENAVVDHSNVSLLAVVSFFSLTT